uniref:MFS domain-containing protein n=1 Tax=Elaeophora elaphi TaxID=1147741 RepID=A0A0R3S137_9BILA
MLIIERFGRRKVLLSSVAGVAFALLFMGLSLGYVSRDSIIALSLNGTFQEDIPDFAPYFKHCAKLIYCLPIDRSASLIESKSLIGPCSFTNSSMGYHWMDDYCATGHIVLFLVPLVTFIIFFACGYAPSSWVINAEIYPMWARSICVSIAASCNWLFDIIASTSFVLLTRYFGRNSAFFVCAALTMVAFVFFFAFLTETKGTSLEDLEKTTKVNQKPIKLVSFTGCSNSLFQPRKCEQMKAFK